MSTSLIETWRCKNAVVVNIMLEVKRSTPVRTIITRPMGNMRAPAVRIRPGACSWYQGAVSVERRAAHLWESVSKEMIGRMVR